MKISKAIPILLAILFLGILVSCNNEGVVDDAFTVTVSFNGNGATSGSMEAKKVGRGTDTRLEANAFERTFYRFTGWNTASDGSGTAYTDEQSISSKENITLYAQWELDPIILTNDLKAWTDGNYYTLNSDVTMSWFVVVTGDVTLILADGYTLTASMGIVVNEGNSLTIEGEGSGTLVSIGSGGFAGIGGGIHGNGGAITINGGTVNATGNGGGAGIGGGDGGNGGVITINNGTITATGGDNGAGIGGGIHGNGGAITINGGTVNATGKVGGAGIGRGDGGTSDGNLTLGEGVVMKVGYDNSYWDDYDGTNRRQYMKTVQ